MKKSLIMATALLAVAAVLGACGGQEAPMSQEASAAPAAAPAASGGGSVSGVATYVDGDPDAAIKMDADPVCASLHPEAVHTEKVVADASGNLANVFVYVKEGLGGKTFAAPADSHLLDQQGCTYRPHVSGMMVGQNLIIRNSDPTLHNVHAIPKVNKEFNRGQPFQDMEFEHRFDQPEVMVRFKCDVHPWMSSYIAVLAHPFFAVSGTDGSYSIEGLPAGTYVLEAWHEELGTRTQSITVSGDEAVEASFDFSPEAAVPAG